MTYACIGCNCGSALGIAIRACLLASFLLLPSLALSAKTCYTPGGEDINGPFSTPTNSTYRPCNPTDGTVSVCCATWDTCMPNGLCWNNAYHIWWRESCTDPHFTDPNCVKLFVSEKHGRLSPCRFTLFLQGKIELPAKHVLYFRHHGI